MTAPDIGKLVYECRSRISAAHARHGDSHALRALICASVTVEPLIIVGELGPEVLDDLAETARNLGLYDHFGEAVIEVALTAGEFIYAELFAAEANQAAAA
jgi:hypothetical protein